MKKKWVVLLMTGVLAAASLTACGDIKDSDVVATVDGREITGDIANFMARYTQAQYETYYAGYMGEDMWSGEGTDGGTYADTVKETILESLENMYLMEDHMAEFKVELSKEEKAEIKKAAKEFNETNGLEEKEAVSGGTETVERALELMTIQTKVSEAIQATADTEVSDDEAAQKKMSYVTFSFSKTEEDGTTKDLTGEEKAELKKTAEEFAKGAKEAKDFEKYAKEQDLKAVETGFDSETATLAEELIQAADKLDKGEVTDVIETDNGYYVAKVTSLHDKKLTEQKKESIISERKQEKLTETLEGWRKDADIEENKGVWKKVDFEKMSVTMKQDESDPYTDGVKTDDQAETDTEE